MRGFEHVKVRYPIGDSRWSEEPAKEFKDGKIGFYEIEFICPKDIRVPILPRKRIEKGRAVGCSWSLEDGCGIYTSVDIEHAIETGYKVKFINKCLVYDKSGDVFSHYIDRFYKVKEDAERTGNKALRSIAKLFLNSLYGKMLARPIDRQTQVVNNAIEFNEFADKYNLMDYKIINRSRILVSGEVKGDGKLDKINKPRQLGAFVTAYSRRIMLFYMKAIDPTLKSKVFTYTDTDSLHIDSKAYFTLKEKGLIKPKATSTLGFLCSDVDDEGLIFCEDNICPKTYLYYYITQAGDIGITMKCKGIPKKALKVNHYCELGQKIEFFGMKKKTSKLTKADEEKGVPMFSVVNNTQTRTFAANEWKNMIFKDNEFYPIGYEF
jgi:hypothetical protein